MLGDSLNKKSISFRETVSVLEAFWFSFPKANFIKSKSDSYVLLSFMVKCNSVLWLINDYSSLVLYEKAHIATVNSECIG